MKDSESLGFTMVSQSEHQIPVRVGELQFSPNMGHGFLPRCGKDA